MAGEAQREMTWQELCGEMVKQKNRAGAAEAEVLRLSVLAYRYNDERIAAEAERDALQAEYRRGVEAMRDEVKKEMLGANYDTMAARLLEPKSEEGK